MTEWKLFTGPSPYVATYEFHEGRERAPHLEQPIHSARLHRAAELIRGLRPSTVVDLGCGDGGLLSLLEGSDAWGYDFAGANEAGWVERGVTAERRDVFNDRDVPRWGQVAVLTETLEHIADPHGFLAWVAEHVEYVVASSPAFETGENHCPEHAWAWDRDGYAQLFEGAGLNVAHHELCGWSQIVVAEVRDA